MNKILNCPFFRAQDCVPAKIMYTIAFTFFISGVHAQTKLASKTKFYNAALLATGYDAAKPIEITGTVSDNAGKALAGVSVTIKGSTKGTSTDADGKFTIDANKGQALEFSIVGHKSSTVVVGSSTIIAVKLAADAAGLTDVIVVGFGKQKKVSVVGAISTVQTKELKQSPTANLSNALAGRLPGLITVQRGGEPGYDGSSLFIRGTNSIQGSNEPLVLVDGIQRTFTNLDANEVESVSILKDASATAVYGIAGANGVILVTTKRGKEGPVNVSFSAQTAVQTPTRLPKYLDSYNYAILLNEATHNDNDSAKAIYTETDIQLFKDGTDPYGHPNTDFLGELLRKYSAITTYNLNISGGNKLARYFINAGYLNQGGLYKDLSGADYDANARFKRYNFRSNIDVNLTEDMIVGLDLSGRIEHRHFPGESASNIFSSLTRIPPTAYALFTPDGRLGASNVYGDNPAGRIGRKGYFDSYTSAIQGTFRMSRKLNWITPGLSANISFAFDNSSLFGRSRSQTYAVYIYKKEDSTFNVKPGTEDTPLSSPGESSSETYNQSVVEANISYQRSFNDHDFTGMVLYTQRSRNIQNGSTVLEGQNSLGKPFVNQGVVGRVTWNWKDKYFAEFNGRYDGSENFAKGKQFGFFPSMALGWVVSAEDYFNNLTTVFSLLKLRGSFGLVGNDALKGRRFLFQTLHASTGSPYVFGDNPTDAPGLAETSIGNPDITWETAIIANVGFESKLFSNKLTFNFDLFRQQRKDLIITRGTIPSILGAELPAMNLGKTINKGFEVELEYRNRYRSVGYFAKGNVSFARNKIIFMDEAEQKFAYQARTGLRISQPFGLVSNGFYADAADIDKSPKSSFGKVIPGDIKYKDANGDGVLDLFDRVSIGHPAVPEWVTGLSAGINIKGIDLSVLFQGAFNASAYLIQEAAWEFFNGGKVQEYHLNRWTPATASTATYPSLHVVQNDNNHTPQSDFWQRSADYLRLKNIEIGYTMPKSWMRKLKIQSVRVYANGLNLVTWDKLKLFDPEIPNGRGWNYPQQKIYNLGASINF